MNGHGFIRARARERAHAVLVPALVLFAIASPASAQVGATLSVQSEERLRGEAISDGRPVATLELADDLPGGFYLGGSGSVVLTREDGPRPFALRANAGYAYTIRPDLTLDLGIGHGGYREYNRSGHGASYTEVYAGLAGRVLSGHVFVSPGYFRRDEPTLYADLDAAADLDRRWVLLAHAGALTRLGGHGGDEPGLRVDWRLGLRRRLGRFDLDAAWVGYRTLGARYGTPGEDREEREDQDALVVGLTFRL